MLEAEGGREDECARGMVQTARTMEKRMRGDEKEETEDECFEGSLFLKRDEEVEEEEEEEEKEEERDKEEKKERRKSLPYLHSM